MQQLQQQPYIESELSASTSRPYGEDGNSPPVYDDVVHNGDEMASIGSYLDKSSASVPKAQAQTGKQQPVPTVEAGVEPSDDPLLSQPYLVYSFSYSLVLFLKDTPKFLKLELYNRKFYIKKLNEKKKNS